MAGLGAGATASALATTVGWIGNLTLLCLPFALSDACSLAERAPVFLAARAAGLVFFARTGLARGRAGFAGLRFATGLASFFLLGNSH